MSDLPVWFTIATIGYGLSFGAALAALWHGLWPYAGAHVFMPNIFAFAALAGVVALVGITDTFRHVTRQPMDPSWALVEIITGGALALVLTQRMLPFVIAVVLLATVRGQAGRLTRVVIELYTSGAPEVARRARRTFTGCLGWYGILLVLFLLFSGLDHSAALIHWTTAPIVLIAGVSGLMLVSGTQYEVMRSRFRGGQVTAEASFGTGWWGPVAGLIATVIVLSAVLPPPPSFITLREVGQIVVTIGDHTIVSTGAQNLTPQTPEQAATPTAKKLPQKLREHAGLIIFALLLAAGVITVAVRTVLYARRAGGDVFQIVLDYVGRGVELARASAVFFTGVWELLRQGLGGDWRGLFKFARQWWTWIVEAFTSVLRGNVWRQLSIRSSDHKAGEEFAAKGGPRTLAGAAWNLPPGDPRRRVRELYRQLLQEAREAGLARRPSQTPAAFRSAIVAAEPATAEGLGQLTGAYEWARFSPHPVSGDVVAQAGGGWSRIAGFFQRRREQQQTAAARGSTRSAEGFAGAKTDAGKGVTVRRDRPRRR